MMSLSGNITCFAESLEYFPASPEIRMRDRAHKRPGELRAQPIWDVRCPTNGAIGSYSPEANAEQAFLRLMKSLLLQPHGTQHGDCSEPEPIRRKEMG